MAMHLTDLKLLAISVCVASSLSVMANGTANSTNRTNSDGASQMPLNDPVVKKSRSNVCYAKSDIGYRKTNDFTPYNSLDECRGSGGRPDKHIPQHQK